MTANKSAVAVLGWNPDEGIERFAGESDSKATDPNTPAALEIARIIYGSVNPKSPQWSKCLEAARSVSAAKSGIHIIGNEIAVESIGGSGNAMLSAQKAFSDCKAFNQKFPNGTSGVVTLGPGVSLKAKIEGPAVVFPKQGGGEQVMAWFGSIGWRDIATFGTEQRVVTLAEELTLLGQQARNNRRSELAESMYIAALAADPAYWHAHNERGVNFQGQFKYQEAITCFDEALKGNPNSAEVLNNRAMSLRAVGRSEEALADCEAAVKWAPGHETIALNCAAALDDLGRSDEAMKIINDHVDRNPNDPNAHYNRALTWLNSGNLKDGWPEFAWRLKQPGINTHYEHFGIPQWKGEPLAGKKVLIWSEQGIGDEIMTASMIPDVIAAGALVTILCSDRLVPVFRRSFPQATIGRRPDLQIYDAYKREPLKPEYVPPEVLNNTFDFQASQGDLGLWLRPTFESFANNKPYLIDYPGRVAKVRESLGGGKLVGISWNSEKNIRIGPLKGLKLRDMAPILKTPGVTFVSLQYGDTAAEIEAVEKEFGVKILPCPLDPLVDMDEYFAVVAAMDLVISVSNTTVHVAGSQGIPTWLMLAEGPGRLWYWFRNIWTSPWYPSIKVFRQSPIGQWSGVVEQVAEELK